MDTIISTGIKIIYNKLDMFIIDQINKEIVNVEVRITSFIICKL